MFTGLGQVSLRLQGNSGFYCHDEPVTSIQRRDQNQQKAENKPGPRKNSFLYKFFVGIIEFIPIEMGVMDINGKIFRKVFLKP